LELLPDVHCAVLLQSVQDGAIADTEDAFDLQDSIEQRQPGGIVPLREEGTLWHEEVGSEEVGLCFLVLALEILVRVEVLSVQDQVPELMGGREDPPLDRYPLPRVHDDGRPPIACGHRQAEEIIGRDARSKELDARPFE
jgi:hypothetical protein